MRHVNNGIYVPPPDHPEARQWGEKLISAADKVRQLMQQRNLASLAIPYLYAISRPNYTEYYEMHFLNFYLINNWITYKDSVLAAGNTEESVLTACDPLRPLLTVSEILLHLPFEEIFEKGYEALQN